MNHNQNDGLLKMIRRTDPMIPINDARQLPIIIPNEKQKAEAASFVEEAIDIKKTTNSEKALLDLQLRVDKFVEKIYHLNNDNEPDDDE